MLWNIKTNIWSYRICASFGGPEEGMVKRFDSSQFCESEIPKYNEAAAHLTTSSWSGLSATSRLIEVKFGRAVPALLVEHRDGAESVKLTIRIMDQCSPFAL